QNGELTANDAASLLAHVLNTDLVNENWNLSAEIADVAGEVDGELGADDAAAILSKVLNSAYEFKTLGSSISGGGTSGSDDDDDDETVGESFYWWFDELNGGGAVTAGTYSAGNGTAEVTVNPSSSSSNYTAQSNASFEYDGTTHKGYWASARPSGLGNITNISDIAAGSAYYFTPVVSGTITAYCYVPSGKNFFIKEFDESGALINTTTSSSPASASNLSITIAGTAGYTYLVGTGGTDALRFYGFKFLVDDPAEVPVSVTIGEDVDFSKATISFKDVDTGAAYATVVDGQTSITLNIGHTYEISIDDGGIAVDYNGVTEFTFTGTETSIDLTLTNVPDVTLTGAITSEDSDNAAAVVTSITFTKMSDETVSYSTTDRGSIDAEAGTYTIQIKPGEYNTSVVTTDGSITNDRVSVAAEGDNVNEIYLEQEDLSTLYMYDEISKSSSVVTFSGFSAHSSQYGVSGGVGSRITVPASAGQTLNIVMSYDGEFYVYDNGSGDVINTGTDLKASYVVSDTATAVTIEVAATGNVASGSSSGYVVSIEYINAALDFVSELSVPGDYDTLNDAIAAIKSMDRPEDEDGRVTITLTSDLQEQVVMDADYVSLDGQDHEITWYYGVGSAYYSVDSSGYYSESLFRDAYSKTEASGSLWGGVMIVLGDYFKAHDVTFKNTYNYYVTTKEIEDGVTPTDGKNERTLESDVQVTSMRERSNALYPKGDQGEYYNCKILSSQDTLGVNGQLYNYTYFKDCTIGGNCDYICGGGTMVFDDCILEWKPEGSSNLGYLTAPKLMPYVFRNCTVTVDTTSSKYVSGAYGIYGRTWASNSDGGAYCIFMNTATNDLIGSTGWIKMTDDPSGARLYEYNNYKSDGSTFVSDAGKDLSKEEYADVLALVQGDAIIKGILGDWTPMYYGYEAE
ncbi:MAG: pectinesterase family protein, partial [Clostridiales bacterium]|nr:pectinesterase family protein [Clostridiales bacterium]